MLSRPQTMDSSVGSSYRVHRKSSSCLSLRREKENSTLSLDSHPPTFDSAGPPNRSRLAYFDAYPRAKATTNARMSKSKVRPSTRSPSRSVSGRHDQLERPSSSKAPQNHPMRFPASIQQRTLMCPPYRNSMPVLAQGTGPSRRSNWEGASMHQTPILRLIIYSTYGDPHSYPSRYQSFQRLV